jgi:hypothetical protein
MADPPRPAGQPIRWSDAAQLAQAIPTRADQERAAALWRALVPGPLKDLLNATARKDTR